MDPAAAREPAVFELYEFIASEYGWTPAQVQDELTREQIFGLIEASAERIDERFGAWVEAVRIGTVIAQNKRALSQWKNRRFTRAQRSRAMDDRAVEAQLMHLGTMFPGAVTRGVVAA